MKRNRPTRMFILALVAFAFVACTARTRRKTNGGYDGSPPPSSRSNPGNQPRPGVHTWTLKQTLRSMPMSESTRVNAIAFAPDGLMLASGSSDKTVRLWDLRTGDMKQRGHSDVVTSVAFSPDGKLLASGSDDKTVKLWDVSTAEARQTLVSDSSINSVAFSPDSKILAAGSDNHLIKLWNPQTGELSQTLVGHHGSIMALAFSPDGKLLASGSYDKTVRLWEVKTGEVKQTLAMNSEVVIAGMATGDVLTVAFSPDGRMLATGSNDRRVRLWDVQTGTLKRTLEGDDGSVVRLAFSPDGKLLASAGDSKAKLWDTQTGELIENVGNGGLIAISRDGKMLAEVKYEDIQIYIKSGG